jgi:hypothetical protein
LPFLFATHPTISIADPAYYDDIVISDDDTIAPNEGFTHYVDQSNDPGCFDWWDNCMGHCLNRNAMYYTTVQLNWGGSNGIDSKTSPPISWTVAQAVEEIVSHEFGHVLGLAGDFTTSDCTEPSIMSLVDPDSCSPNFFGPQSCDSDNVNAKYSGWVTEDYFGSCGGCGLQGTCS